MTIGLTWRRTARRIKRLKQTVLAISPDYLESPDPRLFDALALEETRKKRGLSQLRIGCLCVPGCRGDSVARHSSFKTWSRLGVGYRLRGSHLDQPKYR